MARKSGAAAKAKRRAAQQVAGGAGAGVGSTSGGAEPVEDAQRDAANEEDGGEDADEQEDTSAQGVHGAAGQASMTTPPTQATKEEDVQLAPPIIDPAPTAESQTSKAPDSAPPEVSSNNRARASQADPAEQDPPNSSSAVRTDPASPTATTTPGKDDAAAPAAALGEERIDTADGRDATAARRGEELVQRLEVEADQPPSEPVPAGGAESPRRSLAPEAVASSAEQEQHTAVAPESAPSTAQVAPVSASEPEPAAAEPAVVSSSNPLRQDPVASLTHQASAPSNEPPAALFDEPSAEPSAEQVDAHAVQQAEDFFGGLSAEDGAAAFPVEDPPAGNAEEGAQIAAPGKADPEPAENAADLFAAPGVAAEEDIFGGQQLAAEDLFGASAEPGSAREQVSEQQDAADDLFGGPADAEEPFLPEANGNPVEAAHAAAPSQLSAADFAPPQPALTATDDLFGSAPTGSDPFAGQDADPEAGADLFGGAAVGDELDDILQSNAAEESAPAAASDAPAEPDLFGGSGSGDELDEILRSGVAKERAQDPAPLAATTEEGDLFASSGQDASADLFGGSAEETDLFTTQAEESAWFATSASDAAESSVAPTAKGPASATAEWMDEDLDRMGVPEGWLDEAGGWNWYTEDERREVAEGMGLKPPAKEPQPPAPGPVAPAPAPASAANPYAPPAPISAPAPVPQNPYAPSAPSQPQASAYNPYAPSPLSSTPSYASVQPQQPARAPSFVPVPPTPGVATPGCTPAANPYGPAQPAFPAGPSTYGQTSISPYGPPSTLGVVAPTPPAASKPIERPKQSTAYDPPFLAAKVPRSLSRAPSAAPMLHGMAPSPLAMAVMASPPPAAAPPPPPSAPPRGPSRQGSPAVVLSRQPSYAQAPARTFDPPMPALPAGRSRSTAPAPSSANAPVSQPQQAGPSQTYGTQGAAPGLYGPPQRVSADIARQHPTPPMPPAPPQSRPPPVSRQTSYAAPPSLASRPPPPPLTHSQRSSQDYSQHQPTGPPSAMHAPPPPTSRPPTQPPPRASYDIAAELGDDELISTGRRKSAVEDLAEDAGWPPSDPNASPSYDTTINSVEDMFDPDGPRRSSSVTTPTREPADDDAFDPEGGDAAFDGDEDEEPAVARSGTPAQDDPDLYTKVSPPRARPPITASTFAPPVMNGSLRAGSPADGGPASGNPSAGRIQAIPPARPATSAYDPYNPASFVPSPPVTSSSHPASTQSVPYGSPPANPYAPRHGSNAPSIDGLPASRGFGQYDAATMLPPSNSFGLPIPQPFGSQQPPDQTYEITLSSSYEPPSALDMQDIADDPLERHGLAARRMPCIAFGPHGQIISAFPDPDADEGPDALPQGYGNALSSRRITIRPFAEVVPLSAISSETAQFPGPLVFDGSIAKGSAAEKKKKEQVLRYIDDAVQEIEAGLPYLAVSPSTSARRAEQEARVVLLEIAKLMIKNEGKVPNSETSGLADMRDVLMRSSRNNEAASGPDARSAAHVAQVERQAAMTAAEAATLSDLLLAGDQIGAATFAMDAGLWSHALVIASSIGPDLWKTVVDRFASSALASTESNDGQTLRLVYGLYAGSAESALAAVLPASNKTPIGDWRRILCAVLTNSKSGDGSALVSLGDKLHARGQVAASHACYLLTPSSAAGSLASGPAAKVALYGHPDSASAVDSVNISELVEYALSLPVVPKGKEPFSGTPQLLPYKLNKAFAMLESGQIELAKKYIEAVGTGTRAPKLPTPSPLLAGQLRDMAARLAPEGKPSDTLFKKASKPGLDSLGSWFEGRLTKFIAGDEGQASGESEPVPVKADKKPAAAEIGPFSHYSAITNSQGEGQLSRAASTYDLGDGYHRSQNTTRPPSANAMRSQLQPLRHEYRPASAQSNGSPSAPTSSDTNGYAPPPQATEMDRPGMSRRESTNSGYGEQIESTLAPAVDMPSWGTSYDFDDSAPPPADDGPGEFINPMASYTPNPASAPPSAAAAPRQRDIDLDDEDDLGLGNASSRSRTPKPDASSASKASEGAKPAESPKAAATQDEPAKTASGRWGIGRWFAKTPDSGSPTGPIKAKLGDENAMVYDKELKRWVTKGGAPPEAAKPPPPPPRAQTASPAAVPASRPAMSSSTAPPTRTQSVAPGPPPPSGGGPPLRHQKSALPLGGPPQALSAADVAAELMAGPRKTGTAASKKKPRYVAID